MLSIKPGKSFDVHCLLRLTRTILRPKQIAAFYRPVPTSITRMASNMSSISPKITIYLSPGACSLATHIILHEIDASFEVVSVNARSPLPADFASINPKLRVPVLVLDFEGRKEHITEVPAIMTAIAQMAPARKLLGRTDMEVVRVYEWMNWLSGWLHAVGFGAMWRPQRFIEDQSQWSGVSEKGRTTVEQALEMIEGKLTEGRWAVGKEFSVVDAYLFVFSRWGSEIGVDMGGRLPKFAGLAKRLVERDAVRRTLEEERIEAFVVEAKN